MITTKEAKAFALSLPLSGEHDHWGRPSFRIKGKKIFMTLRPEEHRAVVKLSEPDQDLFSSAPNKAIYPIPGTWGRQGWTYVELRKTGKRLFKEIVVAAWCAVASKKLVAEHFPAYK